MIVYFIHAFNFRFFYHMTQIFTMDQDVFCNIKLLYAYYTLVSVISMTYRQASNL